MSVKYKTHKINEDIEPEPPVGPTPPEEKYGRYRTSSKNMDEFVVSRRIFSALGDEGIEAPEEEDAPVEYWDYDTRINMKDVLSSLPEGTPLDKVFINLNRDCEITQLEVSVCWERPRNIKEEKKKHKEAVAKFQKEYEVWKVAHAAWVERQKMREIEELEQKLSLLKIGK